jgi:polyisoprenoid-binding protein YceI
VTRYRIAPERSHVWIDARSNVHPIHSETDGLEGFVELTLDSDGGIDLSVKPAGKLSLAVTHLSSGNRMEDRELQKRIDARRYPTIEGTLDSVTRDGDDGSYRVSGDISFRGVSQHHEDLMRIRGIDETTVQLDGSSRFDIRDFGMEPPRMLMLKVEPDVDVRIEVVAIAEAGG